MEIRRHSAASATDAELVALTELANRIDPDRRPGDPAWPVAHVRDTLSFRNAFHERSAFGAWVDDTLVGVSQVEFFLGPDNRDLAEVLIGVDHDHRHTGIGTRLLEHAMVFAADNGRTRVTPWSELTDESRAFYASQGFVFGFDERISRLDMAAVDPNLMQSWIDQASERASAYHLERWIDRCPDHLIEAYVAAKDGMNEAPLDDLVLERRQHSAERTRASEQLHVDMAEQTRVIMAVETATGQGAAYTSSHVLTHRRSHSWQGDTTTLPSHRNRGIGRWIKAAMWQWLRDDCPDVAYLDTGNADSNDAMLAINVAMGFEPQFHYGAWQKPDAASSR